MISSISKPIIGIRQAAMYLCLLARTWSTILIFSPKCEIYSLFARARAHRRGIIEGSRGDNRRIEGGSDHLVWVANVRPIWFAITYEER